MIEDAELLRRYAANRTDADFAEVVRRHVNLVYSAALRQVSGDAHLAQDITQMVFTDLARKAGELANHRVLAGWLFTSTRFAAAKAVRSEQRRKARDEEAQRMQDSQRDEPGAALDWTRVRPVLDAAIGELNENDREAILLRFFEGRDFAVVGERLRVSDNTARMRVERALDKLRGLLERRGVTSTTAALGAALANQAVVAAPTSVTVVVTGVALAGAVAGMGTGTGSAGVAAVTTFMSMTKLQLGLAGAVAMAGATGFVVQAQSTSALRQELERLQADSRHGVELRVENQRLANLALEAADLRTDDVERVRLRDEIESVRRKMQAAARASAASPAISAAVAGPVYDINQLDQLPQVKSRTPPKYPLEMREAGASGEVTVDFIVDANGEVQSARALKSTRPEFEPAAIMAVSGWKFSPGRKSRETVNTHMQVPIVFTLSNGASSMTKEAMAKERMPTPEWF